jgi:hypothetical protein
VIGSRFVEGSVGEIPTYRKVGMKVLDTATTMAGNDLAITDSQSGFSGVREDGRLRRFAHRAARG